MSLRRQYRKRRVSSEDGDNEKTTVEEEEKKDVRCDVKHDFCMNPSNSK